MSSSSTRLHTETNPYFAGSKKTFPCDNVARSGTQPTGFCSSMASALLRVFCHATGDRVILLLGGYDKGKDPARRRQDHEIEVARRRLAEHLRRRQGGGWDLSGLEET